MACPVASPCRSACSSFSGRKATPPKACLAVAMRARPASQWRMAPSTAAVRLQPSRHSYRATREESRQSAVCAAPAAHPGEEREAPGQLHVSGFASTTTGMAKGLGSFSGGATLQRSKMSLKQETKSWTPSTDNSGGSGNGGKGMDIGGGGDGGDDDDDDYFNNFGDGDGDGNGDDGFWRSTIIAELYDMASINAVLQEWFRDLAALPVYIRQFVAMGLFSSAQLVRFLSMDVRPSVTRAVTRSVPVPVSRGFVGRLMADPAFVQKLAIEQLITISSSLAWEAGQRRDRFFKELDLVLINTLCLAASSAAVVSLVAPTRSHGGVHKMPWQQMMHNLPNNIFEMGGPQRTYTLASRTGGFVAKVAELSAVGTLSGAAMSLLGSVAVAVRRQLDPEFKPSVPVPGLYRSAAGSGVAMGVYSNLRYQVIAGVDRELFLRSNVLPAYLALSTVVRVASNRLGEPTRLMLQGLPVEARQALPAALRLQPAAARAQPARQTAAASRLAAATGQPAEKRLKKKKTGTKKSGTKTKRRSEAATTSQPVLVGATA